MDEVFLPKPEVPVGFKSPMKSRQLLEVPKTLKSICFIIAMAKTAKQ